MKIFVQSVTISAVLFLLCSEFVLAQFEAPTAAVIPTTAARTSTILASTTKKATASSPVLGNVNGVFREKDAALIGNNFPRTAMFIGIGVGATLILLGCCTGIWCLQNRSKSKKDEQDYKIYLETVKKEEKSKPPPSSEPPSNISGPGMGQGGRPPFGNQQSFNGPPPQQSYNSPRPGPPPQPGYGGNGGYNNQYRR